MIKEKFVDVNGAQVMDLTPDHERALALVDLKVLNKLANLLPKANTYEIVQEFASDIQSCDGQLKVAIETAEEFVAFHKSVNLIREISSEEISLDKMNECRL